MAAPTKEAIIGTFINGRNAQDDFLQLATNHGGTVFAWIDYLGRFNGTFATSTTPGGSNTDIQFNNNGVLGGDSGFTYDSAAKFVQITTPYPSPSFLAGGTVASLNPSFTGAAQANGAVATVVGKGTGAFGSDVIDVFGQNGPITGVYAGVWQDSSTLAPFISAVVGEPFYSGITTGEPAEGFWGIPHAINGANITGDDVGEFGYIAGARFEPHVDTASHVDFELGAIAVCVCDDTGSSVINQIGYRSINRINAGSPSITNSVGFKAESFNNGGSGSGPTNVFGFYSQSMVVAGSTQTAAFFSEDQGSVSTNYSLYFVGGNNHFGGTSANITDISNPTASTGIANHSSPILSLGGTIWNGAASISDTWTIQNVVGAGTNPSNVLTFIHTGSSGTPNVSLPYQITLGLIQTSGITSAGQINITNSNPLNFQTTNGATRVLGSLTEEITLNTGGTTTDSVTNLLPSGAIIESVVAYITQTISGGSSPTTWEIGDATTAARFTSTGSALTATTTVVGLNQMKGSVTTDAAGPTQAAAAKVRITLDQIPGQGKVRVTVFYSQFTPPTS